MKKTFFRIALCSSLFLTAVSCGNNASKDSTGTPVQQAALYQCPMQCEGEKTYDKPSKCPVCGMDLKPVETKTPATPDSTHTATDSTRAV